MKSIRLEIIQCAYIFDQKEIEGLNTKMLVPKMMTRRRLTRAAKIAIYLSNEVSFTEGRIVYGSSFGELEATANILNSITNKEAISPTYFQNSVYNTAISYLSILQENEEELLTISSGVKTSDNVLKVGAVKSLDGDTLLLLVTETLNIEDIEKVNTCEGYLECAVALKVRHTDKEPTIQLFEKLSMQLSKGVGDSKVPPSVRTMLNIARQCKVDKLNVIEVLL